MFEQPRWSKVRLGWRAGRNNGAGQRGRAGPGRISPTTSRHCQPRGWLFSKSTRLTIRLVGLPTPQSRFACGHLCKRLIVSTRKDAKRAKATATPFQHRFKLLLTYPSLADPPSRSNAAPLQGLRLISELENCRTPRMSSKFKLFLMA